MFQVAYLHGKCDGGAKAIALFKPNSPPLLNAATGHLSTYVDEVPTAVLLFKNINALRYACTMSLTPSDTHIDINVHKLIYSNVTGVMNTTSHVNHRCTTI
jgi:hypothetical protein